MPIKFKTQGVLLEVDAPRVLEEDPFIVNLINSKH
jgi:hypothetical protein